MNLCVKCDFWYFLNLFRALDLTFDPWHNPSQSNQKTVHFIFCINAFIDHYALLAPAIYPASSPAVYRYFSDRARATAARNLSIDTWTSGVKSLGNMVAMTTRRLWERICERRAITHMLHIWRLLNMHTGGLWPLHGLRLRKTLHHSSVSQNESVSAPWSWQGPHAEWRRAAHWGSRDLLSGRRSWPQRLQLQPSQSGRASSHRERRRSGPSSGRSKSWSAGKLSASWMKKKNIDENGWWFYICNNKCQLKADYIPRLMIIVTWPRHQCRFPPLVQRL